ncbi:T9SS type A sorting domain-containing protein [Rubrivirga sp.]|uniref:T9SS type A sorting domain-containing protein n=1 Tax=Rubrivirga sp. TaxID=1885344 RepID=UPI003B51AE9A
MTTTHRSRLLATLALGAAALAPGASPALAQPAGDPPAWASVLSTDYPYVGVHDLAVTPAGPVVVGGGEDELRLTEGAGAGIAFDLGLAYPDGELSFVYAAESDGTARWARSAATDGAPFETYHVAAGPTPAGDVIVTGEGVLYWHHPYRWDTGSERVVGRSAADGSVLWTVRLGHPIDDGEGPFQSSALVLGVGVYDGVAYLAGVFRDTLALGPDTLVATPASGGYAWHPFDVFVAALDAATGEPVWTRSVAAGDEPPSDVHDGRFVLGDHLGHMAFDVGGAGVVVGGLFPAGSIVGRGMGDPDGAALPAGTALVRLSHDGAFDRSWTQTNLGLNDDVLGPGDSDTYDPEGRNVAWPIAVALAPDGGVVLGWAFVPGRIIGPSYSHVEAGSTTYTDAAGDGRLVTRHGPDGTFEWAVDIVTPQRALPSRPGGTGPLSLDVGHDGRVALGTSFSSDDVRVAGAPLVREGYGDGVAAVVSPEGELRALYHVADEPGASSAPTAHAQHQSVKAVAFGGGAGGPSQSLYVAGRFRGSFEVGGGVYRAEGENRTAVFLSRFDLAGVVSTDDTPESAPFTVAAWPNPATTAVRLSVDGGAGSASIRVFDVLGREVAWINRHRGEVVLDVSGWGPGVYVVEAREDGTDRRAVQTVTVAR